MHLTRLKTEIDISDVRRVGFRQLSTFFIYENKTITIEIDHGMLVFYLGDGHLWKEKNKLVFRSLWNTKSTVLFIDDIDTDQLFNAALVDELYGLDMECIGIILEVEKIAKECRLL